MSIKVVYDISTLATAFYHPETWTGVCRTVEHIAVELRDNPECDLSFCAFESFTAARQAVRYLAATPQWRDVPLVPSGKGVLRIDNRATAEPPKLMRIPRLLPYLAERSQRSLVSKGLQQRRFASVWNPLDLKVLAGKDLFHSPFLPLPAQLQKVPKLRRVLTVYDLIPILFPRQYRLRDAKLIVDAIASLQPEDWVLCISQSAKDDLCAYRRDLDPQRVRVTPLAASEQFHPCTDATQIEQVREKYHLTNAPYLLSVCRLAPHKNIGHLIRSFGRLVKEQNITDLNLVLVGTKGPDYHEIVEAVTAEAGIAERVIATSYVADEDLSALYSGALSFVFPSLYEGFGLPPLEAMQCGVPVICSNTSSLPEVVGEAGILVEPTDEDALCAAMLRVYEDEELRAEMSRQSLGRAALFSWRKCAELTFAAYQAAVA